MKKILTLILSLCLVGLVAMPVIAGDYTRFNATEVKRTRGDNQENRDSLRINDNTSSGNSMFRVDRNGNVWILDTSGATSWQFMRDRYVYIDSTSDLSTWSGAAAGSSYFQMEAGKTYIFDPQKIYESTKTTGTGVTEVQGWSGVTAHLPLATAGNDRQTVSVMWATTGSLAGGSGSTTVQVWPAPDAGTTTFRANATLSQNFTGMATSGSSVVTVNNIGSLGIDAYGETGTWRLFYNSAVSAQMVDRDLP